MHIAINLVNNQLDTQLFFLYVSVLYMFRETSCSSSGESIASIRHLVYVNLCRWPSSMQVGRPFRPAYQTVTYTEWHIPDVVFMQLILLMMSTGLLETCRELKRIEKRAVRQVSYLQEPTSLLPCSQEDATGVMNPDHTSLFHSFQFDFNLNLPHNLRLQGG